MGEPCCRGHAGVVRFQRKLKACHLYHSGMRIMKKARQVVLCSKSSSHTLLQLNDGRSGCNDNHHLRSPPCVAVQLLQVCYAYTCVYVHMPPMATDLNFPCVAGWSAHELRKSFRKHAGSQSTPSVREAGCLQAQLEKPDTLSMRLSCPQRTLLNGHTATALLFCSLL